LYWDEWLSEHLRALDGLAPAANWELPAEPGSQDLKRDLAYILWLIRLSPEQQEPVAVRLKLPVYLVKAIRAAGALWQDQSRLVSLPPSLAAALLEDAPALARYALYLAASNPQVRQALERYTQHWRKISPLVDGHTLRRLGLSPGPVYRQVLSALRAAWLDGEISTPQQEQALLEKLLAGAPPGPGDLEQDADAA
jgi:tRNA nucleotidyltransferase (CCA-adding enzyme)